MGMFHQLTFSCDSCETEYMIDHDMELPPGWLGVQIVVADSEGCVPEGEQDLFCHFCSQKCLLEYCGSRKMRERLALTEKHGKRRGPKDMNNGDNNENPDNSMG